MHQLYLRQYFSEGVIYPLSDSVEELIYLMECGAKIVQLRDKKSSREEARRKVDTLCGYISRHAQENILLIVNDDVDMAVEFPVAGVHLGQDDGNLSEVRERIGKNKIIGRSTHSLTEAQAAVLEGADYISIGPVYPTGTKPERKAVGISAVREVAAAITTPWLAIGGINKENIDGVRKAGATSFAVVQAARSFFPYVGK